MCTPMSTGAPYDGFDCGRNNPCSMENSVSVGKYYSTADWDTYIQCGSRGACLVMNCNMPFKWDRAVGACA